MKQPEAVGVTASVPLTPENMKTTMQINEYVIQPNFEQKEVDAFSWELIGITAFAIFMFTVMIVSKSQ